MVLGLARLAPKVKYVCTLELEASMLSPALSDGLQGDALDEPWPSSPQ